MGSNLAFVIVFDQLMMRLRSMNVLTAWNWLQDRMQAFEAVMVRRETVVRFLLARFLLMLAMVLGFWLGVRQDLHS